MLVLCSFQVSTNKQPNFILSTKGYYYYYYYYYFVRDDFYSMVVSFFMFISIFLFVHTFKNAKIVKILI
ncbi:MAG: hypothetical protein N7Q72_05005, partial [Spiroplasma sp. Tabriz.8]|nr:hypothetical protein [Spiroplasma sp. Tabriz.8]